MLLKFDVIWDVLGVSEKLILFCHLQIWSILVQMISNFYGMHTNNTKFYDYCFIFFAFQV